MRRTGSGAEADDPRARLEGAVVARLGGVGDRDDVARTGLHLVVAEPEGRPAGDEDVDLLVAAVALVVLDVRGVLGIAHDAVDAEGGDPEPLVQRLPAPGVV